MTKPIIQGKSISYYKKSFSDWNWENFCNFFIKRFQTICWLTRNNPFSLTKRFWNKNLHLHFGMKNFFSTFLVFHFWRKNTHSLGKITQLFTFDPKPLQVLVFKAEIYRFLEFFWLFENFVIFGIRNEREISAEIFWKARWKKSKREEVKSLQTSSFR